MLKYLNPFSWFKKCSCTEQTPSSGRCDPEVYNHGATIAVLGDVASEVMEAWVQMVARKSGQKVDWFYMGGRAVVKAVGNLEEVDKWAYWTCIRDGKIDCMDLNTPGKLRDFGGACSWYGYYPGGVNHWSMIEDEI